MSYLLAFDCGLARIGVAVGQTITQTATPLSTLSAKQGKPDWQQVEQLIKQWQPQQLIVGEPFNMDASDQDITLRVRKFANRLSGRFGLPCQLVDERLSSAAARDEIFESGGFKKLKKTEIDSIAAALILESWLQQNP